MSNLGLEIAVRNLGLDFKRAKVGDRYIMEMLLEGGWTLGGETSGHIICLDLTNTGDGIVSALQVLEAMVRSGKSLDALKSGMSKYPQQLINVTMDKPVDLGRLTSVQNAVRDVETELGGDGRVLLRPSGTEPVVRVMVEGKDAVQVNALANQLASAVKDALAGVQHL
jgi:phosphoglucosamine mutase